MDPLFEGNNWKYNSYLVFVLYFRDIRWLWGILPIMDGRIVELLVNPIVILGWLRMGPRKGKVPRRPLLYESPLCNDALDRSTRTHYVHSVSVGIAIEYKLRLCQ